MQWLSEHPYLAALVVAGVCIAVGFYVVESKTAVQPQSPNVGAWGGGNVALLNTSAYAPTQGATPSTNGIMQQVGNAAPYSYIAPTADDTDSSDANQNQDVGGTGTSDDGSFDFNAFVASLSQANAPKTTNTGASSDLAQAYAFIPQGLISTSTGAVANGTVLQTAMYDYGNEAGSDIQSFEEENQNEAQVLTDQVQDRSDSDKAAAVVRLGQSLAQLGKTLSNIQDVPAQMGTANNALAQSYIDIGTKLQLVPQAQSDSDYVAAIENYDATADTFAKHYVALVQLFGSYGVTFDQSDPGSVFVFSPVNL